MSLQMHPHLFRPASLPQAPSLPRSKAYGGRRPRILLVTPELGGSRFLARNGKQPPVAKAGGLADVCALLVDSLSDAGADVHVALPHFKSLFHLGPGSHARQLHLCQDREFCYRRSVYEGDSHSNLRASFAFQRDVIQYVMPRLRPDIVHCHDWMTGLVPAAARVMGIPSLFTIHNLHEESTTLGQIEDRGIDAARFWQHLYYHNFPGTYEITRDGNPIGMLASGILAADRINTVSQGFLGELADGAHGTAWTVADAVRGKLGAGGAFAIPNSLPPGYAPSRDASLAERYDANTHASGKRANKRTFQRIMGLEENPDAPLLFWPSRLDPAQKGCDLLAGILYQLLADYRDKGLQVAFVADGPGRGKFEGIADFHGLHHRIAARGFNESLSRLGYGASDFTLVPSVYEPCGLVQMIGLRYGSLPIVHATGGLRDTVMPLDPFHNSGNGFLFEFPDCQGLRWAIDQAMHFHEGSPEERELNISRIMTDAADSFLPETMVRRYLQIYRDLLKLRAVPKL